MMKVSQMTTEDLSRFANQVKGVLADECNIPELDDYIVIVADHGFFGKAYRRLMGEKSDRLRIYVAKPVDAAKNLKNAEDYHNGKS